jgi:hypothetical protein
VKFFGVKELTLGTCTSATYAFYSKEFVWQIFSMLMMFLKKNSAETEKKLEYTLKDV